MNRVQKWADKHTSLRVWTVRSFWTILKKTEMTRFFSYNPKTLKFTQILSVAIENT